MDQRGLLAIIDVRERHNEDLTVNLPLSPSVFSASRFSRKGAGTRSDAFRFGFN